MADLTLGTALLGGEGSRCSKDAARGLTLLDAAIGAQGGRSIDVPVDPAPIAGSPSEVDCFTDARDASVGVWRLCWKLALAPSTGMHAVPVQAGMLPRKRRASA